MGHLVGVCRFPEAAAHVGVRSRPVDRWFRNVGRFVGDEIEQIVVTSTGEVEVTVIDLSTYDSVSFDCERGRSSRTGASHHQRVDRGRR